MVFVTIQREGDIGVMRESIPQPSANARNAQSAQHCDKNGPKNTSTARQLSEDPGLQVTNSTKSLKQR